MPKIGENKNIPINNGNLTFTKQKWVSIAAIVGMVGICVLGLGVAGFFASHGKLPHSLAPLNALGDVKNTGAIALMIGGGLAFSLSVATLIGLLVHHRNKKNSLNDSPPPSPSPSPAPPTPPSPLPNSKNPSLNNEFKKKCLEELSTAVELTKKKTEDITDSGLKKEINSHLFSIQENGTEFIENCNPETCQLIWQDLQEHLKCIEYTIDDLAKITITNFPLTSEAMEWQKRMTSKPFKQNLSESIIEDFILKNGGEQFLDQPFPMFLNGTLFHHYSKLDCYQTHVKVLLRLGVEPARQDNWGNTGLMWAIANASNETAMQILINAKPDSYLDAQCYNSNNTALHLAVGKGYRDISRDGKKLTISNAKLVQEMIERKANVNLQNADGNTPLHLAFARRDFEMTQLLKMAGADPTIKNHAGKTSDEMSEMKYEDVCALLDKTVHAYLLDKSEFDKATRS